MPLISASRPLQLGSGTQAEWIASLPTIDVLNRCIPRTASSSSRTKLCAYPPCTSAAVVAIGVQCDTSFGQGAWPLCNNSSPSSSECAAEEAVCQVQVETGSYVNYATQTNDEQSAALVQSIAGRVGQTADTIDELWRARTPIIVGGVVFPILLAVAYMVREAGVLQPHGRPSTAHVCHHSALTTITAANSSG